MLIIVIETHCNAVDYGKEEIRKWFELWVRERESESRDNSTLVSSLKHIWIKL